MTTGAAAPEPRKLVLLVCKVAYNKHAQRVTAYYSRQNASNVVVVANSSESVSQFLKTFKYKYTGKPCCWFCDVYIHYIGSGADLTCTQQSLLAVRLDAATTLDVWNDVCMEVCKHQRPLLVLDCTQSAEITKLLEQHMSAWRKRGLPLVLATNGLTNDDLPAASAPASVSKPDDNQPQPAPEHVGVLSRMVARQKPFQQWHAHHAVTVGSTNATFKPKNDADVLRLLGVALFAGCAYIRATNSTPAGRNAGPTVLFTKSSHMKPPSTSPVSAAPLLPQHLLGSSPFTVHRMHAALPTCPQRLSALELYRDWVAASRDLLPFFQRSVTAFTEAVTSLRVQATQADLATPAARTAFTSRFTGAAPVLSRLPTLLLTLSHPPALPLAPAAFSAFASLLLRLLGLPDCLPPALTPIASLDLRRLLASAPPHNPPTAPTQCLLALALCLLLWLDPLRTFDALANLSQVPPDFLQFILAFVHGGVPLPEVLSQLDGVPGAEQVGGIMRHVYARRIVRAELVQNLDAVQREALQGILPYHVVPDSIPVCQYDNLLGHYKRAVRQALQEGAAAVAAAGDGAA